MSIQIYHDQENHITNVGKRGKRVASANEQSKIKRVALGMISDNTGCRIQPSRAAKGKLETNLLVTKGQAFPIFNDEKEVQRKIPLTKNSVLTELPMILSPALCNVNSIEQMRSDLDSLPSIKDIDLHADPTLGMPEYATDIYLYLKKVEQNFRPKTTYMQKQKDINPSMRAILVDWLVEVGAEYKLKQQTLYLTVNYIDRFLSSMSVLRGKLQLVGAACMLVAAKFEEIYPPEIKEFVYITDDTYTTKQILRMEHLILKTLSFDLSVPTCKDFLTRYVEAADAPAGSKLQFLSAYICELSIVNLKVSLTYLPSEIAAASICVANMTLNLPPWSRSLEFYTAYKIADISLCIKDVYTIFTNASTHAQQAVQTKYKSPKLGCVSQITPCKSLDMLYWL